MKKDLFSVNSVSSVRCTRFDTFDCFDSMIDGYISTVKVRSNRDNDDSIPPPPSISSFSHARSLSIASSV